MRMLNIPCFYHTILIGLVGLLCTANLKILIFKFLFLDEKPETTEIAALVLLVFIINLPPNRSRCAKKVYRPTRKEVLDSFLFLISDEHNILTVIQENKERHQKLGIPLQPYVICLGESLISAQKGFVVVDSFFYSPGSVLQCIDVCFKKKISCNAKYPLFSEYVWLAIQKLIYKIDIPDQHIPASVLEFIMSMNFTISSK